MSIQTLTHEQTHEQTLIMTHISLYLQVVDPSLRLDVMAQGLLLCLVLV